MLFNNELYNVLKNVALIWLPALGTLYFSLAKIWDLPSADEVTGTIVVIDTFMGVVLGLSSKAYDKSDLKYDGEFLVDYHPEGGQDLRLRNVDFEALNTKSEVLFKISDQ